MSPQALSDMNVIDAEYETVAIEDSAAVAAKLEAKLNSRVVRNEICAILFGVPTVVTTLVSLGTLSSGLPYLGTVAGILALTSGTITVKSLIRRHRALSQMTPKPVVDRSVKVTRTSPSVEPVKSKVKINPPVQKAPEPLPTVFTSHGLERLCEFLRFPPEALDDLKRAVETADFSSEQVKHWVQLMSQSQYHDPDLDHAGDNIFSNKQTRRFKRIMKQWYHSSIVEDPVVASSGSGFWGSLFGVVVGEVLAQTGSRSSGGTNHLGLLLSAPDPDNGRTEYVKDSRHQVVGCVYNQNGWIYYKDERYQVLASKRYQRHANGSIDYRHYEIRDSRHQIISYR